MPGLFQHIPYCGSPPSPGLIWARWNADPILIAALVIVAALYVIGARRSGLPANSRWCFYAGWALTAAALISPLCPLSVSLFEARVGQHMILTLIAAPLVALARPAEAIAAAFGRARPTAVAGAGASKTAILAAAVFAALLWGWHMPVPYSLTFESTLVYWLMHLTLYGSALWLWSALLLRLRANPLRTLAAGLFSTVQMGLLGALITLSPYALYTPHFATTWPWGLTPLQDQQVGGVLMWVPGCAVFLAAAMAELWAVMSPSRPANAAPAAVLAR